MRNGYSEAIRAETTTAGCSCGLNMHALASAHRTIHLQIASGAIALTLLDPALPAPLNCTLITFWSRHTMYGNGVIFSFARFSDLYMYISTHNRLAQTSDEMAAVFSGFREKIIVDIASERFRMRLLNTGFSV